jgi:hypothetical protein
MATLDRRRAAASLVAALAICALPPAARAATADRPDLVIRLPAEPYPGQVAPAFVDRFVQPGRVLYRFDAIIENRGGTLDIFRDGAARPAVQAIWDGGRPPPGSEPDPGAPPAPSADVTLEDRSASGASFTYVVEPDHAHWHFSSAARYELLVPGGEPRVSDKVGFCMFDSFDTTGPTNYFPPPDPGSGQPTWCAFNEPDADFVHMGLSPGASDRYRSQRHFQWVDITGLAGGGYTLRGTANPAGYVLESDTTNNVLNQPRTIPGARAFPAAASTTVGDPVEVGLHGAVIAAEIPARRSGDCQPEADDQSCYQQVSEGGPLDFDLVSPPQHGAVTIVDDGALGATVHYSPAPGFVGEDSFGYTATDERRLTSPPATATVSVTRPAKRAARRKPIAGAAVRRNGGRWYAVIRTRTSARIRGVVRYRRRLVRRLRARRLPAGRHRIALGALRRAGQYELVLRAKAAGGSQRLVRRFRVTRR